MSPSDPLKHLLKNLYAHDEFYRQFSSIRTLADIGREIMRPFELPRNPIQSILDQESRTAAAIYQSLNSVGDEIRKHLSATATFTGISQGVLSSVAEPQSVFQKAIEVARSASISQNLNAQMAQALDAERLTKLCASSPFDQLWKSIESVSVLPRIWQSTQIADLASRVVRDADFRSAFIERLETEMPKATGQIESSASSEQLVDLVEREITASGVTQESGDAATSLNKLFSLWSEMPQDLRTIVMMLLVMLLQVALQYSPPTKQQPATQVVVKQYVKVIQNISNNYFTYPSLPKSERPYFGVVTKEQLPVFVSNRRDSVRLANLPVTQIVTIKNQKRNWVLVEWRDAETNEMRSGWTFTRYLKKI